jgi:hypothetical protein
MAPQGSREKGVFSANRFRLGGIVLLVLAFACVAAPAHAATVEIDDPTVTEGDSGTSDMTFTLTLTTAETTDVTVNFQTDPGEPAYPGDDYEAQVGQVTWSVAAGETDGATSKTVTVPIVGDTIDEPVEYLLLNYSGTGVINETGIGTIMDNDAALSVADITFSEGSGGTTNAAVRVAASSTDSGPITVDYSTSDGSATSPGDYTPASGTLTFDEFAPETQTFNVALVGDAVEEASIETFLVDLTNATNGRITRPQAVVSIKDDDGANQPPPPPPPPSNPVPPAVITDTGNPTVQTRVLRGLSLRTSNRRVRRNRRIRLTGILRASGGPRSCRSRQKIALQRRKKSGGRFQTFEVAVTNRAGSFRIALRPVRTYVYRARVSQTTRCMGATSKTATVVVRKRSK